MSRLNIPMVDLTKDQKTLIELVYQWFNEFKLSHDKNEQVFVYSGFPGTGKTFILNFIIDKLGLRWDETIFCAFTGKAASNLCKQGFNATTIHSSFFELVEEPKIRDGKIVKYYGRDSTELKFREKKMIDDHIKLIIIDEWGVVNEDLAKAILKHNIPVLAAGDKDQLPPIYGESPFAKQVRFSLTQIMRQAEYSGIIQLASLIREGGDLPLFMNFYNDAWVLPKEMMFNERLLQADMILTVKNKTRNMFNTKVRELNGSTGKLPRVGDKLICRKNQWNQSLCGVPLINGTIGRLRNPIIRSQCELNKNLYTMDFQPDFAWGSDDYYEDLECDYEFLNTPCGADKYPDWRNPGVKIEYAEAITVTLSQGSQYNNVVYYDEFCGDSEFMRKVRYTACTRAVNVFRMYI